MTGRLVHADFVLSTSASVGVPVTWLRPLGVLKGAGAVGLVVGLHSVPRVGLATATGLVLFFVCAMAAHVRSKQVATIGFPAGMCALAATSLTLGLVS